MNSEKQNMYSRKIIIYYILLLAFYIGCSRSKSIDPKDKPLGAASSKLLIVSYDGFRNDYFNRNITDYLNNLRLSGTYADYMKNVFPTKTFPNHHSIATGWYADKHGVTGNSVFDNSLNHELNITELFDYAANQIIPIWVLNQKSGPNRYSGCMMWPGIENRYHNETCHFIRSFTYKMPFEERVDQMMKWFTDPVTPINLGLLYVEEPDNTAHVYGPDSSQVNDVIRKINNVTEYIEQKLIEFGLTDVNVIYLSDHGMDTVLVRNIIDLNNFIKNDTYKYYGTSPVLQIVPNNITQLDSMYKALRSSAEKNGNFTVYLNSELPAHWHFRNDQRVGPITVLANEGFGFQDLLLKLKAYQKKKLIPIGPLPNHTLGVHGYDNEQTNMHAFFMARGPNIQVNTQIPWFSSVELYGLFCELLNLAPTSTSNFINSIVVGPEKQVSRKGEEEKINESNDLIFFGIIIVFVSLVLAGIGIRISMTRCNCRQPHIHNVSDSGKAVENQHLMVVTFSESED